MEEETESAGDGDESLLHFGSDGLPNNGFDIRTDAGVVVLPELSGTQLREQAKAQCGEQQNQAQVSHYCYIAQRKRILVQESLERTLGARSNPDGRSGGGLYQRWYLDVAWWCI